MKDIIICENCNHRNLIDIECGGAVCESCGFELNY